jgi:predicted nucleic acid-binding protein
LTDRRVLLDTGPLVALLAASDAHHRRCVDTFATLTPPLFTCWPVITEAAWILRKQPRPLDHIAEAYSGGMFDILPLDGSNLNDIAAILRHYEDSGIQFADAALVYLAERENIRTVFTTDRRDFSIIRLKRNRMLKIIPEVL